MNGILFASIYNMLAEIGYVSPLSGTVIVPSGLDPTGVSDNTNAIQTALNTASATLANRNASAPYGSTAIAADVWLPPGVYFIATGIVIPSGVRLIGSGLVSPFRSSALSSSSCVLIGAPANGSALVTLRTGAAGSGNTCFAAGVENIAIVNTTTATGGSGIGIASYSTQGCVYRNINITGFQIGMGWDANGASGGGSGNMLVENVNIGMPIGTASGTNYGFWCAMPTGGLSADMYNTRFYHCFVIPDFGGTNTGNQRGFYFGNVDGISVDHFDYDDSTTTPAVNSIVVVYDFANAAGVTQRPTNVHIRDIDFRSSSAARAWTVLGGASMTGNGNSFPMNTIEMIRSQNGAFNNYPASTSLPTTGPTCSYPGLYVFPLNPVMYPTVTAPAIAGLVSGTAYYNPCPYPIYINISGATTLAVKIGTTTVFASGTQCSVYVPAPNYGASGGFGADTRFTVTYTGTPAWTWYFGGQ